MEIIFRGTPPKDEVWYGYCENCMTHALELRSKLELAPDTHRGRKYAICVCPVCHQGPPKLNEGMIFYKTLEDHCKL